MLDPNDYGERRCIECGYSLRGLSENRCPECGRAFDPHDPATMHGPLYRQRIRLTYWLPALVLLTTFVTLLTTPYLLISVVGIPVSEWVQRSMYYLWIWWPLAVLAFAWVVRSIARRAVLLPFAAPRERFLRAKVFSLIAGIIAAAVVCGGGIRAWTCPHGDNFAVGPIMIARHAPYGPCNNQNVWWKCRIGRQTHVVLGSFNN